MKRDISTTSHKHSDFVKEREKEGRQDFEVIIRGVPGVHLSHSDLVDAIYDLVKVKAEALPGDHPYFDIEVTSTTFSVGHKHN